VLRFPRETNRDKPGTIDDSVSGISLSLFLPFKDVETREIFESFQMVFSVYIFVGSPFYFVSSWLVFFPFFFFYLLYGYGMLASTLAVGTMATFFFNILFLPPLLFDEYFSD
jgi:hypothetical protein